MLRSVVSKLFTAVIITGSSLYLTACAHPPSTPPETPLERALEAATSGRQEGGGGAPGVALSGQGNREEISDATAANSLAQILVEAEKEQHPLAFYFLPKAEQGHYVDWSAALKYGVIKPIDSLDPNKKMIPPIDFNVIFKVRGELPEVVFPHLAHTVWLDCTNCHPKIFVMRAGVNRVTMDAIREGQFCGQCHGKVAFPLSDCNRCHSRPLPGKSFIIPKAKS
jgi:c(7)-type cytochrome triheme protein